MSAKWAIATLLLVLGCAGCASPVAASVEPVKPIASAAPFEQTPPVTEPSSKSGRRPFEPTIAGRRVLAGISYGPYRAGQRPGGPDPSGEQILEDLRLIAERWSMIRIYSSRGPAEAILRTIRDHDLPLVVMLGAWIAPNAAADNAAETQQAVRLSNSYRDQVIAVSVGNETQVAWSGHRSPAEALIAAIRDVRAHVTQPVTTADDYNFWNKPESHAVADEVDFLVLHAYAMWNKQPLDEALAWTDKTVASIAAEHPRRTIVLGETGWATELNREGDEVQHIRAPAGEAEQAAFFNAFSTWAGEAGLPYFYFEAFDEPWKGGDDPRDVEKHWGLYHVDRTPKAALREETP